MNPNSSDPFQPQTAWCRFILAVLLPCLCYGCRPSENLVTAPLEQEAYVWQRAWTPLVQKAVMEHGTNFSRLLVLAAEVSWERAQPHSVPVRIDYSSLRQAGVPFGLCLRIGTYPGPFARDDRIASFLASLCRTLISESASNGVSPVELQIDFDCATGKLAGYGLWLETIRTAVAPVPVTITALPSWLESRSFDHLIASAPSYVLQVHALRRPDRFDERFKLCDPLEAKKALRRAAQFGVPFRVALPTYAYLMAFDESGALVGVRAEGPAREWPPNVTTRELWANPPELAQLLAELKTNRPSLLQAITWYRFPVQDDRFNWRWKTLAATMQGRLPQRHFRVNSRRVEAGLVDIYLVNEGELDISSRLAIKVRWQGTRYVAADALSAFELVDVSQNQIRYKTKNVLRLRAGQQLPVGWLRLTEDREVVCECEELGTQVEF